MNQKKTGIFIVDDHPIVIAGLESILTAHSDFKMVGSADTINSAVAGIRKTKPDIVIIDISLKNGESGLDLVKTLKSQNTVSLMLVMSRHEENLYAERALRAGAMGYLMKDEAGEKIFSAMETIQNGKIYLKEELASKILNKIFLTGVENSNEPVSVLSSREMQVYELIGSGFTTKEIAGKLFLSVSTVETHCKNIKVKLRLKNARELTHSAVQWVVSQQSD